ncbi:MAG: LysR family transcriptional regulator [Gammaproteobacteria bacterium]|nr:LysR family transcriptional regulator [Gammaproteobacteria bacterium]
MTKRRLPPVSSLVPFDVAARLGSMSAAARELGISQPAISRHLRQLEADLGQTLFERSSRGLSLTAAGRDYRDAVRLGLDHIARATAALRAHANDQSLNISSCTGFAQQWLMPRLSRLRSAYPKLFFRLITNECDDDRDIAESDIVIRFGTGHWPGLHARQLFAEEVFPVCSNGYLTEHPSLRRAQLRPRDLLAEHLLHLDEVSDRWLTWHSWLQAHQVTTPPPKPRVFYSSYPLLLQSALAGEGIALGWRGLVDPMLESGSLVQLLPSLRREQHGYFLCVHEDRTTEKLLRKVTDWIVQEATRPAQRKSGRR